jgi:DNA-directed RNA polymerase sigma subunit (sigma70/sigma32)
LIPTEEEIINHHLNKENYITESNNKSVKENVEYVFNILDQIKDKRVERVFSQRYFINPNKKSSWASIAKNLGVTTQTVINLHNKGMKILRKKMNSKDEFVIDII